MLASLRAAACHLRGERFVLCAAYLLAHGLSVANPGLFWDDWTLAGQRHEVIFSTMREYGTPWWGAWHVLIDRTGHAPLIGRSIILLAYLGSALLLRSTLRSLPFLSTGDCRYLSLFFALLPVNAARIAFYSSMYAATQLLFFLGLWLTGRWLASRSLTTRLGALAALFASFTANSFLVFHLLVLARIAYAERHALAPRAWPALARRHADFICLPIAFWILRTLVFPQSGQFSSYNAFRVAEVGDRPWLAVRAVAHALHDALLEPLAAPLELDARALVVVLVAAWCLFRMVGPMGRQRLGEAATWGPFVGLALVLLALAPYLAVGKLPRMYHHPSRFQLLLPLGLATLLYFGIRSVLTSLRIRAVMQRYVLALLVVCFVRFDMATQLEYLRDAYKQEAMIVAFRANPAIRDGRAFLFEDHRDLNARGRYLWVCEWTGLLRRSFGDSIRFGSERAAFRGFEPLEVQMSAANCNVDDFVRTEPRTVVRVLPGPYFEPRPLGWDEGPRWPALQTLKLLAHEHFSPRQVFVARLSDLIRLEVRVLGSPKGLDPGERL